MLEIFVKNVFGSRPAWLKDVEKNGQPATAVILADPKDYFKDAPKYEGADVWLDLQVRLEPPLEAPFEGRMKCLLSQILGGMLEAGMRVNAKYDPAHKDRLLLVDDITRLLQYRVKK
jgi:hypothetical protein